MDFVFIVKTVRLEAKRKQILQEDLKKAKTLTEKFIVLRKSCVPYSIVPEKIIKEDLQIGPSLDKISGDGDKNDME